MGDQREERPHQPEHHAAASTMWRPEIDTSN